MANDSDLVGGADLGRHRAADADDVLARLRLRARLTRNAEAADLPPPQRPRRVRWRLSVRTTVLAGGLVALGVVAVILAGSAGRDQAPDDGGEAVLFEPLGQGATAGIGQSADADAAEAGSTGDGKTASSGDPLPGDGLGAEQADSGQGGADAAGEIVVHVAGAVGAPGVVAVPADARVFEAVEAAGGALAEADLDALNLARPVSDGERIYVPRPGETIPASADPPAPGSQSGGVGAGTGATAGLVDINRAGATELQALPGVGPVLAERIVAYRADHGPFASVDALLGVSGIGPSILAKLAPAASVG